MAEYIEREAAIKVLYYNADESCASVVADFEALPAADVELVVHGKWLHVEEDGMTICGKCSNCKYTIFNDSDETNYCPSCGAKMEGAR